MENSDETSSINLSQYKQLTKNNMAVLKELIKMTIDSFETYKNEFKNLIESRNKKEVGLLAHKLKTTIILLEARALDEAVKAARRLLYENGHDSALEEAILNIHQEFDKCSGDLEMELKSL